MIEPFVADLEEFCERFRACGVRREEWTHRAHLAVGAWHVDRFGTGEALARLRPGISRLNESFGNENTDTAGYHETITAAYVHLIGEFLRRCPRELSLDERVKLMLSAPLARPNVLLTCYSESLLMSPLARKQWVEPDRLPLRLAAVSS